MNCYSCRRPYDDIQFVPRLLIGCGHSLCQCCIMRLHSSGRVVCPDCQTSSCAASVQGYPKNLALINIKHHQKPTDLCTRHSKKFEAFCDKDKLLLCVNCILEDGHRNHPVDSIANAHQKEKDKLTKVLQTTDRVYQSTQDRLTRLEESLRQAGCLYEENEIITDRFFTELRKVIAVEEQSLKTKFKDGFTTFEGKCREREQRLMQQLEIVDRLLGLINHSEAYDSIEFLDSIRDREQLMDQLMAEGEDMPVYTVSTMTKGQLCETISRQLDKLKAKDSKDNVKSSVSHHHHHAKKPDLINDRMKKLSSLKENNSQKPPAVLPVVNKKVSKKETKESKKTPPIADKILAKCQVSVFEHDPSLFKSFLSSNASFFLERRFIYVFGGFCEESNSVMKLSLESKKWEHVTPMENRSKFGLATVNGDVMILGGKRDKQRVAIGQCFHGSSLSPSFGLESVRSGFGTVVLNEEVVVIGGNDGDCILKIVEKYNQNTGCWLRLESLNESRDELASIVGRDGKVYAIGGFGGPDNVCLKSVERYDPLTNRWQFMKSMLHPRRALSVVTLADGIYAIGGFDGQNYLNTVQRYDEFTGIWQMVCPMTMARCTHHAVAVFQTQQIYVMGGFDYSPLSSVEKYSVMTDSWEEVTSMPMPRFMHGCVYLRE